MTKSATRESADKVTFTQTEVTSAVALKAPIATPVFTGNVGIGVTPESDIVADRPHLRIGSTTALSGSNSNDQTYLSNNAKQVTTAHASGWEYLITDYASQYKQKEGTHVFQVAPSGSADAAISWNTAMSIDNAGIVTKPLQPAFDVYHNGSSYNSGNTTASMNLNTARHNTGSHYNLSSRRFVAPVAGVYQFNFRTIVNGAASNAHLRMYKNGSQLQGGDSHYSKSGSDWSNWSYSLSTSLSANDYIEIKTGSTLVIHGNEYQSFNGYLIG